VAGLGSVSILCNGDGSFQPPSAFDAAEWPNETPATQALAAGDFNGDGTLDVAVTSAASISVRLGNGGGSFQPPASYAVGGFPISIAVGDLNGDDRICPRASCATRSWSMLRWRQLEDGATSQGGLTAPSLWPPPGFDIGFNRNPPFGTCR
jgi:hypothetical protein